jgi:hypothetical protein
MNFTLAIAMKQQLTQLQNVVTQLSVSEFQRKSVYMSGASIGQHTRHIIELLQCLLNGYESGIVNYDDRKRDQLLETDVDVVLATIIELSEVIQKEDKSLLLKACYGAESIATELTTTYHRELAYNLEHTIHHLALMKPAFIEFGIDNKDGNFGVAYATIQYRKACAQ